MQCRICDQAVELKLDLGYQPLANALLDEQGQQELKYPLKFYYCHSCHYGCTDNLNAANIFDETYPYYSSVNKSYVKQCKEWAYKYRKEYNPRSVLEIGCNDGYMLENFKDIIHLGYEPSNGPYRVAIDKGLDVLNCFFKSRETADLIIANNVLAHTPNLSAMARDIADCLNKEGHAVIEFPALHNLINDCHYDTIYHEHFSYFTLYSMSKLFQKFGLFLFRYENIPSHGGSIRAYFDKNPRAVYTGFSSDHQITKDQFDSFKKKVLLDKEISLSRIIYHRAHNNKMVLYGAAAKGNTWLNYLGLSYDFFDYCVDETPYKQGKYLPGSRIPVVAPERLLETKPNFVWILPWNFRAEIMEKTKYISDWGGQHLWKSL